MLGSQIPYSHYLSLVVSWDTHHVLVSTGIFTQELLQWYWMAETQDGSESGCQIAEEGRSDVSDVELRM